MHARIATLRNHHFALAALFTLGAIALVALGAVAVAVVLGHPVADQLVVSAWIGLVSPSACGLYHECKTITPAPQSLSFARPATDNWD